MLKKLFHRQNESVLLIHRRDVVETIEIADGLQIGFMFDQLLGPAVEQSDMRIDTLDDLTIEFQDETQYAVSRRVLGPEIDGEIAISSFGHGGPMPAAATSGRVTHPAIAANGRKASLALRLVRAVEIQSIKTNRYLTDARLPRSGPSAAPIFFVPFTNRPARQRAADQKARILSLCFTALLAARGEIGSCRTVAR